ncbi:MAG: hypothetical protein ACE5MH_02680 [Terriglobia bacterium]
MVFQGGKAGKYLDSFCRRLQVQRSDKFHGFWVRGTGVLYCWGNRVKANGKYPRWDWKNLLGRKEQRTHFKYVLLHGPKHGYVKERFFFIPRKKVEARARTDPALKKRCNIAADPLKPWGERTPWVYKFEIKSVSGLRRALRKL